jgi:uncharacterized protein (DUF1684 family)
MDYLLQHNHIRRLLRRLLQGSLHYLFQRLTAALFLVLTWKGAVVLVLMLIIAGNRMNAQSTSSSSYRQEIEQWRAKYEERLKAEDGWLALAGLYWLKEGDNWVGTIPSSTIRLHKGPATLGNFHLENGVVRATFVTEIPVRVVRSDSASTPTDKPSEAAANVLRSDSSVSGSDVVRLGDISIVVIKRADRYGLRVRDSEQPERKNFRGCVWHRIDEQWRVRGKFTPYPTPKMLPIVTVIGDSEPSPNPGYVTFTLAGKEYRLEAQDAGKRFFFNFKDASNKRTTYPAGRFLYADKPNADGTVWLDFNKAYSPPCAFTQYATRPLAPRENTLNASIDAGEKYGGSKHK